MFIIVLVCRRTHRGAKPAASTGMQIGYSNALLGHGSCVTMGSAYPVASVKRESSCILSCLCIRRLVPFIILYVFFGIHHEENSHPAIELYSLEGVL